MASVTFKITRNDISPALSRMAATARNPRKVLLSMGNVFQSITMGNFRANPSYRPQPWAPKRDGSPSFLMKNNVLSRSFHLDVTDRYAKLGTPMIYAAIHQFGGIIKGRPWLMFQYGPGKKDWATVAQVKIPARPFFPVENGRLTEKAAKIIGAAGERAMLREAKGE